jgi:hypothetical protein
VVVLEPMQMLGAAEAATAAKVGEEKAKNRYKPFTASTDLIRCMNWAKLSLHSFVLRLLRHRIREAFRYRQGVVEIMYISISSSSSTREC